MGAIRSRQSAIRNGTLATLMLLTAVQAASAQAPKGAKGPPAQPAAKVFVEEVRVDTLNEPRTFVGTTRPLRKSLVGSAASGRVEEYLINDGDFVQKGQAIAKLRTGVIQAEVNAAQAELRVRQAALSELEKSFQDEIEQGRAKLKLAEANRDYRRAKRDRSLALGPSISKETLDEDIALATQAEASVVEAQATLRLLEGGAREQKTEQARARLQVQDAEVERLTEQLNRHTMFSPFDGYVTAEHAEVGQWLMQGDPVAEIIELAQVDVEINVLEDYVGKLDTSVLGTIEIAAARREPFAGTIAMINPQADARARTFPVKVRVENTIDEKGPLIKAGMIARVTLPVGQPTEAQLVPKDAVVLGGTTPVVYIVDQKDVTDLRTVLEDDARITYHATVLAGTRVGRNAMVGALALATKDVKPFHVNVGIPAKSIRVKPNAPPEAYATERVPKRAE
jgi:multidrug efflux pump subunit AcrA (membrane-fusion protein)